MRLPDFELERYFARWEFAVRHLLCASDVEGWPMADLLALADDETRAIWADLRLGYTESTGHPLLRAEIARLYGASGGESLGQDDILVFTGAEEAIFCLLSVELGAGDHAIVTWPGYQSLYDVARGAGAEVTLHELREADGWSLDVDRLVGAFRPTTRLVVVNAPHNPTGMLPTPGEWASLADACERAGVRLVADEVYRFLEYGAGGAHPILAGAETGPRNVSIGVMSKSFAMAGLRIGWLATRDRELLRHAAALKDYTTICPPAPSEVLALVGLRARDRVLARSRTIVAGNLALLDGFFERRAADVSWVRPVAGPVGFPRLTAEAAARFGGIEALATRLVETEGVLLLPGSTFGFAGEHFRFGFGREGFGEGLALFERFLEHGG